MENKFYKNIAEALPHENPGDKVVKIIDNKFAVVQSVFTDGRFDKNKTIMYLDQKTVYSFSSLSFARERIDFFLSWPNIEKSVWCMDHSENGKPLHSVTYCFSNRRLKHIARRLLKALNTHKL